MTDGLRCNSKLFASDITIFTTVYGTCKAADDLSHELNSVNFWVNHPWIFLNDTLVKKVQEQKCLGLLLDSTFSFSAHIKSVISKVRQGIGMLKALSKSVPRHILDGIYKLYTRPHLDYVDVIYHTPHSFDDTSQNIIVDSQMEKLESVQYSAALAVTNAWKGTSLDKFYEELGWESLNLRRWSRRLILFCKIMNYLTPDCTRHPIPSIRDLSYNFSQCNVIGQICARSTSLKSSFYPSCLSEWERLDPEIGLSNSVSMFKKKILAIIRPNPKS